MKRNLSSRILMPTLLLLMASGCFSPEDIKLTEPEKRAHVDSVYQLEYERLQPILDKSCADNFEKLTNRAVDSLVNVYLDSTKYDY